MIYFPTSILPFQHTAARRRLQPLRKVRVAAHRVSTHSRPKAAAAWTATWAKWSWTFQHTAARRRLHVARGARLFLRKFQHTAARRRLQVAAMCSYSGQSFQHTAARRRLPGVAGKKSGRRAVSTHSRPKAAAPRLFMPPKPPMLFQHTAARRRLQTANQTAKFQHTAARRRLPDMPVFATTMQAFQHTAARRRLLLLCLSATTFAYVSTHSRPKAAAGQADILIMGSLVSTHSRPKAAASG